MPVPESEREGETDPLGAKLPDEVSENVLDSEEDCDWNLDAVSDGVRDIVKLLVEDTPAVNDVECE